MKHLSLTVVVALVSAVSVQAASVMITGQTAGPTPFIAQIQLTANPPNSVKSIKFQIAPQGWLGNAPSYRDLPDRIPAEARLL